MIRTLSIAIVTCAVALLLSAPASAVIYFEENFDTLTDGSIVGQTSGGQTWANASLWANPYVPSTVAAAHGVSGKGLGRSTAGYSADYIEFASAITTGPIYIDMDLLINPLIDTNAGPQFWLNDNNVVGTGNDGQNISLAIDNTIAPHVQAEASFNYVGTTTAASAIDTADDSFHMSMSISDISQATANVTWSMKSLQNPSRVSTGSGSFEPGGWNPDALYFFSGATQNPQGYDNIRVASTPIPEPTSLLLFGLGTAGICCFRPRRRRRR